MTRWSVAGPVGANCLVRRAAEPQGLPVGGAVAGPVCAGSARTAAPSVDVLAEAMVGHHIAPGDAHRRATTISPILAASSVKKDCRDWPARPGEGVATGRGYAVARVPRMA